MVVYCLPDLILTVAGNDGFTIEGRCHIKNPCQGRQTMRSKKIHLAKIVFTSSREIEILRIGMLQQKDNS